MEMEGTWLTQVGPENGYEYTGKEINEDFGLNWYDYGARWYDAAVGRWWSVDPMGESTMDVSPYTYVTDNPMILIDPTGMFGVTYGAAGYSSVSQWADAKYEENERRNEERKEKKSAQKEEEKTSLKLPTMYIANVVGMNATTLGQSLDDAGEILKHNGIPGVNYEFVSVEEAKKHDRAYAYQGFLAIVSQKHAAVGSFYGEPGYSRRMYDGTIGVHASGNDRWMSYVNIGDEVISDHPNTRYAAGYIIAHETLHQFLHFASHYRNDGVTWDHNDSGPNLNREGHKTKIPNGPSPELRPEETIVPSQLSYLLSFFNQ